MVREKIKSTSTRRKMEDEDIFFGLSDSSEVSFSGDDNFKRKEAVEETFSLDGGAWLPYSNLLVWRKCIAALPQYRVCFLSSDTLAKGNVKPF